MDKKKESFWKRLGMGQLDVGQGRCLEGSPRDAHGMLFQKVVGGHAGIVGIDAGGMSVK